MGRASITIEKESSKLRQGFVESSNVDAMTEMVGMMTALRHLEMSQRVVKGFDEIIGSAIQTIGEF